MARVPGWHANIFGETAGIDVGGFESSTHRIILVQAVMARSTGNMVSHDHMLPDLETGDGFAAFDNRAGQFMPQDNRRRCLLRDFEYIGAAQSTTMHPHK